MRLFATVRLLSLVVLASAHRLEAQAVRVAGTVRDATGAAVMNAEVTVDGIARGARTDSLGRYHLERLPAGRVRLIARRLGYLPAPVDVALSEVSDNTADFRLDLLPQDLAPVTVVGRMQPPDRRLVGFYSRAQSHAGGHFVTREQIEHTGSTDALQLLRGIPSVRVLGNTRFGRRIQLRGNDCNPLVFIDGFPAGAGPFDFESLDVDGIEGIEVYGGLASVPPELVGADGRDRCGVIAVWGRQARPSVGRTRLRDLFNPARVAADRVSELIAAGVAFPPEGVDAFATIEKGSFTPAYPASLLRDHPTASIRAEFIVDSTGQVLWQTYSVVSSTDRRFNTAVRDALTNARFTPAIRAGRRVGMVVHLPVFFEPPFTVP